MALKIANVYDGFYDKVASGSGDRWFSGTPLTEISGPFPRSAPGERCEKE